LIVETDADHMTTVAVQNTEIDAERVHWAIRLLLVLFVLTCAFDPADQILGGKVQIFVALWAATLLSLMARPDDVNLPAWLLIYVLGFVAIPLFSVFWYYVIDGKQPFEGFVLLKGYLLMSLAVLLVLNKVDLIPLLSKVLTIVAVLVIGVFAAIQLYPGLLEVLYPYGGITGAFWLDERSYGDNLKLLQVYLMASPMLAIAIAYYFDCAMSLRGRARLAYFALVGINVVGMVLAGTRNNILVALLLPFVLWPFYTRRVVLYAWCSLLVVVLCALPFADQLAAFFDPTETGNSIKLTSIQDYIDLFSNPVTLLLGQGLGAYHFWSARGYSFYVTELTYLEMIRNFGLIGAIVMMAMLFLPVAHALTVRASRRERALAVAYFLYLVMCASNPNLFCSLGMLILAILVANIALDGNTNKPARSLA
jgi:hypothetical protein